jgi:hypothetical protein
MLTIKVLTSLAPSRQQGLTELVFVMATYERRNVAGVVCESLKRLSDLKS